MRALLPPPTPPGVTVPRRERHDDRVTDGHRSAVGAIQAQPQAGRVVCGLFGEPLLRPLVVACAAGAAADALFTLSLAGSLFFSVSAEAARSRVLVYLLMTLAPFAVVGPFVGPLVDRLPGGQRLLLAGSCAARAAVSLLIARHLSTLFFFPEAFAVLVLGKSGSIAKSVLVPWLVADENHLVAANAQLSRMTTLVGGLTFALGAGLLKVSSAPVLLIAAAVAYLVAAGLAVRIPRVAVTPPDPVVEEVELRGDALRLAANAMSVVRATVGFLAFLLAFNLRSKGEPPWVYGLVIAVSGAGGFIGTFVAVLARRRLREEALLAVAMAVPGGLAVLGSIQYHRSSAVLAAFAVGMGANIGHHAFDSITQRLAPDAEKGRAFARFETQFQLAWVVGALVPVLVRMSLPIGLASLGLVLCGAAVLYGTGARAVHHHEVVVRARLEPAQGNLPASMLTLASALHGQGAQRLAVLTAVGAVAAARASAGEPPADPQGRLHQLWREAATGTGDLPEGAADEAITLAGEAVHDLRPGSLRNPRGTSPTEPVID
jgi:hypothetical protein